MIRLTLRLDDPSETSHQEVEAGILEILRRHHAQASFATIPFRIVDGERRPLSAKRALPLVAAQREGLIEIALHGYLHRRRAPEPAPPTEFRGRPRDEQWAMIDEGRRHLEAIFGTRVTGFVPPWNSHDAATIDCLAELGFDYLSGGRELPGAERGPLRQLPRTAQVKDFDAALAEAARFEAAQPIVIFVLHHYDFAESGVKDAVLDLHRFDRMLGRALARPGTRVVTLKQLAGEITASDAQIERQYRLARQRLLGRVLPRTAILDAPLWRGILAGLR